MVENSQKIVEEEKLRLAVRKHDPKTVAIASLFIGGMGHLQMGSILIGMIMLIVSIGFWCMVPLMGVGLFFLIPWNTLCAFLAFRKAKKFQNVHGIA